MFAKILAIGFVVVATSHLVIGETHGEHLKEKMEMMKCHKGYKGLAAITEECKEAAKKCEGMNIKDRSCFVACILQEKKIFENGKFNMENAKKAIHNMFDAEHVATADKWAFETNQCVDEYEKAGKKFPTDFHDETQCKTFHDLKECVAIHRKCP